MSLNKDTGLEWGQWFPLWYWF